MKLFSFPSVRALITLPRVVNERLIPLASFKVWPEAPVFPTFSDPAKSTKYNFPDQTDWLFVLVYVTVIKNNEWDLLD